MRVKGTAPVLVTVATDWVTALLTRLLPKLNEVALKAALVKRVHGDVAALMLWVSEPEVAWSVMLVFPAAAVGPAVTVSCCREPGATERVIGETVMPLGKEPTAHVHIPGKAVHGGSGNVDGLRRTARGNRNRQREQSPQ